MTRRTSDAVLAMLGAQLGRVSLREIRKASGFSREQLRSALRTLERRGFAERMGLLWAKATPEGLMFLQSGKSVTPGYTQPRATEPKGSSLRARLWKAIRMAQKASVSELMELAARESGGDARRNAREYLQALARSGHLILLSKRAPSEWPITTGESRYCLALNTGPRAPQYNRRQKRLFDPNTGETYDLS